MPYYGEEYFIAERRIIDHLRENGFESSIEVLISILRTIYGDGNERFPHRDDTGITSGNGIVIFPQRATDILKRGRIYGYPYVNIIPGIPGNNCCRELITICLERDSLSERLREMIYHIEFACRGINKNIIFLTSKWSFNEYKPHATAIESLKRDGIRFVFLLIGPRGVSIIDV